MSDNIIDWPEETRIDAIGQNGGDGIHYTAETLKSVAWALVKAYENNKVEDFSDHMAKLKSLVDPGVGKND